MVLLASVTGASLAVSLFLVCDSDDAHVWVGVIRTVFAEYISFIVHHVLLAKMGSSSILCVTHYYGGAMLTSESA